MADEHVGVTTRAALLDDLPEVLRVQRAAFVRVADHFGLEHGRLQPLQESLAELQHLFAEGAVFLVAEAAGTVVGTVRATTDAEGAVHIGRLAVDDGWERRGIATTLMREIESAFPEADTFVLFTGAAASGPLALYERLGYRESARETTPSGIELVHLTKRR